MNASSSAKLVCEVRSRKDMILAHALRAHADRCYLSR